MRHLNRLVSLWKLLATQTQLSRYVTPKDIAVFESRALAEGLEFLTVVMPRLGKALDFAFREGKIQPVTGFRSLGSSPYPRFLQQAWSTIFNEDGSLRSEVVVDADAVVCIRQLTLMFYKLNVPYAQALQDDVIARFVKNERELASLQLTDSPLIRKARWLVHWLVGSLDPYDIIPIHSSGASACRVDPAERYDSFRYCDSIAAVYPYDKYFFANATHLADEADKLLLASQESLRARVVLVPKDSRGPRLISCEPRELMYLQQGLMAKLYDHIRSHPTVGPMLDFTQQERNRAMAQISSLTGEWATLDLKDASDRVSLDLVTRLFPADWVRCLSATRSKETVLPDGTVVPQFKFAPMGSAVCFPVEAIVFWAISLAALFSYRTLYEQLWKRANRRPEIFISVFGDDIIVPQNGASRVVEALQSVGLIVNESKSYWTGPFRESCGGDYYKGSNVTPVRVKHPLDDGTVGLARALDLMNNLIIRYGFRHIGHSCHELLTSWYGPIPVSNRFEEKAVYRQYDETGSLLLDRIDHSKTSNGLYLYGCCLDVPPAFRSRVNPHLHRREFKILVERAVYDEVDIDRWSQVLRWFSESEKLPDYRRSRLAYMPGLTPWSVSDRSCQQVALAKRTRIKYGWVSL